MLAGLPVEMLTMLGSSLLGGVMTIWGQRSKDKANQQKMLLARGKFQMDEIGKAREYDNKGFQFTRRIIALTAVFFIIAFPKLVPVFTDVNVVLTWTEFEPGFWFLIDKKEVVMGFGHRVYRTGDSRVPTMKHYMFKVAKLLKKEKYTKMYEILEKVMLERKNIHPNVDFPCGPTYYMMGVDIDFYTPIFVMSRITGWSAHIMEQHASNKLIRPLSKYKGKEVREVMLLNQR